MAGGAEPGNEGDQGTRRPSGLTTDPPGCLLRAAPTVETRVMHELAITESVVEGVAERFSDSRVTRVVLEIGELSGVVPDAIRFCFDVCAQGTPLQGATLEIVSVPARARCSACQREIVIEDGIGLCPCGSADLAFLSGQELKIKAVAVA